ncbi:Carbonic anhydrase [Mactra antiquata]
MTTWGYRSSNGPSTWVKAFPLADGKRQSPINISTSSAKYDAALAKQPIRIAYSTEKELCLQNSGKSVVCQIKATSELSGGPLTGRYKLEQFHLHWGSQDNKGSEHTIDGKEYAAELHLVHYNTKYGTFKKAVDKSDGLAVLGIIIEAGAECKAFKTITDNVCGVTNSGTDCRKPVVLDPATLLPDNTKDFWTYEGSLTTPPLFESVQWIVFKQRVQYSHDQLEKLRSLIDSDNDKMQNNYRPPVDVNGRQVRASFQ